MQCRYGSTNRIYALEKKIRVTLLLCNFFNIHGAGLRVYISHKHTHKVLWEMEQAPVEKASTLALIRRGGVLRAALFASSAARELIGAVQHQRAIISGVESVGY